MRLQLSGIGSVPASFSDEAPVAARVTHSPGLADDMTQLLDAMRAASAHAWGAGGIAEEDENDDEDDDILDSVVSLGAEDNDEESEDNDEKTPS